MFPRQQEQQSFFKDLWAELAVKKERVNLDLIKSVSNSLGQTV